MNTQAEAKRFLAEKVIAEAERQGAPLSKPERLGLYWSESDPEFLAQFDSKPDLLDEVENAISDEQYEAKIAGLFEAVYRRELEADLGARDEYRRAYSLLKQGDHYIVIIIDQAVSGLRPWTTFALK